MPNLLQTINSPADLRAVPRHQLPALADELRSFVLNSVAKTGGHLSSNLGTVELTVALHYVFNTPHDRIVWDVGHQTYPHKILTGRRDQMGTLRQRHGLSGFPRRDESEYDAFGTAHSSTSISAALGMAIAAQQKGEQRHAIAVIGDGAMTAGMAFEALNNGGVSTSKLLVILNDNDMSISPPVGALNRYLAQLMSGKFYSAAKEVGKQVLKGAPPLFELAKRFEEHAKGMVVPATLFEKFGFNYIGPIDGHDLESLIPTLENLKHLEGPQFLHVVTKKGQGYKLAEADPVAYHGPGKFDPAVGLVPSTGVAKTTFTQVFGDWLCDMAEHDPLLVGITPAMREGSGMVAFHKRFPERYHDVGIAEQHAVTFAAGLACEGVKPVVAIYSTFLQRAYDQVIHDVALQKLPMVLALDRAGIVGADGATHAGLYDIPFMRCIPNVSMACPADENECRQLLTTAYQQDHCVAVRYPRGAGVGVPVQPGLQALPFGKGEVRREGKRIAILAFGTLLYPALQAGEALNATVVNMRWAKPLDTELLAKIAATHDALVTIEEGAIMGGAGSAVLEALQNLQQPKPVLVLGIGDVFTEHGDPAKLLAEMGLDATGIQASIEKRFATLLN
ncbi:MAG: 1-deoxy-D-xylulose-5-phosphate synthase [Burkholderiales bacterium 35-55-47]|jgi:1-deoxy-D-xylulose-5-phosphate synthase|uniref:1-deoxy-D-xylulose-5-phosphate synthase n=1 Tax=Limnohabitans sp. TaxID=1907725 RepID=UPI000BD4FA15|nr:1-deoxy-D-xylulose-5-phosphate synthase [Limnohabitans sp.]OYY19264.1 MAG: 1-deoxy-D-xylulose-5-phosphate synthase [Burkholderiales bacterium 35-55-47]OYZ73273.1 MAG: 1-deoxy-D-xylulose-5-phosphate synthase [Burkholderiales bacterium 24-55-52]OZB00210.1 MAG: 1-deoxy-D-xylulose-5-phosphate synthase [Burkholderiales bacterium 39-55-53]HQR87590.1 1-deoxy-D-xylulose-5-phosphate synthase [Limnohabitans sp.]HQS27511.1 1-deoxy-D-xylulose-5-phosphate synthase [Limnohabitans sp.]